MSSHRDGTQALGGSAVTYERATPFRCGPFTADEFSDQENDSDASSRGSDCENKSENGSDGIKMTDSFTQGTAFVESYPFNDGSKNIESNVENQASLMTNGYSKNKSFDDETIDSTSSNDGSVIEENENDSKKRVTNRAQKSKWFSIPIIANLFPSSFNSLNHQETLSELPSNEESEKKYHQKLAENEIKLSELEIENQRLHLSLSESQQEHRQLLSSHQTALSQIEIDAAEKKNHDETESVNRLLFNEIELLLVSERFESDTVKNRIMNELKLQQNHVKTLECEANKNIQKCDEYYSNIIKKLKADNEEEIGVFNLQLKLQMEQSDILIINHGKEVEFLKARMEEKENYIKQMNQNQEGESQKLADMSARHEILESHFKQYQEEMTALSTVKHTSILADLQIVKDELNATKDERNFTQNESAKVNEEMAILTIEYNQARTEMDSLQQQLSKIKIVLKKSNEKGEKLSGLHRELNEKYNELKQQFADHSKTTVEVKNKFAEIQKLVKSEQKELEKYIKINQELSKINNYLKSENFTLGETDITNSEFIGHLKSKNKDLEQGLKEAAERIVTTEEEQFKTISILKAKIQSLKSQVENESQKWREVELELRSDLSKKCNANELLRIVNRELENKLLDTNQNCDEQKKAILDKDNTIIVVNMQLEDLKQIHFIALDNHEKSYGDVGAHYIGAITASKNELDSKFVNFQNLIDKKQNSSETQLESIKMKYEQLLIRLKEYEELGKCLKNELHSNSEKCSKLDEKLVDELKKKKELSDTNITLSDSIRSQNIKIKEFVAVNNSQNSEMMDLKKKIKIQELNLKDSKTGLKNVNIELESFQSQIKIFEALQKQLKDGMSDWKQRAQDLQEKYNSQKETSSKYKIESERLEMSLNSFASEFTQASSRHHTLLSEVTNKQKAKILGLETFILNQRDTIIRLNEHVELQSCILNRISLKIEVHPADSSMTIHPMLDRWECLYTRIHQKLTSMKKEISTIDIQKTNLRHLIDIESRQKQCVEFKNMNLDAKVNSMKESKIKNDAYILELEHTLQQWKSSDAQKFEHETSNATISIEVQSIDTKPSDPELDATKPMYPHKSPKGKILWDLLASSVKQHSRAESKLLFETISFKRNTTFEEWKKSIDGLRSLHQQLLKSEESLETLSQKYEQLFKNNKASQKELNEFKKAARTFEALNGNQLKNQLIAIDTLISGLEAYFRVTTDGDLTSRMIKLDYCIRNNITDSTAKVLQLQVHLSRMGSRHEDEIRDYDQQLMHRDHLVEASILSK